MKTKPGRLFALTAGLSMTLLTAQTDGQVVQVSPGYVRAPFVRVERGPNGETRVRAPFVETNSPGYRQPGNQPARRGNHPAQTPTPVGTRGDQLTDMEWSALRLALRDAAGRLDGDLNQIPSGHSWRTSLHPGLIRDLVVANVNGPPASSVRAQLTGILESYDIVAMGPENAAVTNLRSFRTVHAALDELLTPAQERLHHQLVSSSHQLHQSLAQINNGVHWQQYLAVPTDATRSNDLDGVLQRFDQVNSDNRYRMISSLPAFQKTHRRLATYIGTQNGRLSSVLQLR